jgi:hypothetical protein
MADRTGQADSPDSPDSQPQGPDAAGAGPQSVGAIAELYLGNVLYALERCAMSLEADEKPVDAAFYRAIGRKLADAHGRARTT